MEPSSRCTAEGPTAGGDSKTAGGDFVRKPTATIEQKHLKENVLKSMRVTAQAQQRLFGGFFFNHYAHSKGVIFFSFQWGHLSRLVKSWMREEKSVNREILLKENTGSQQEVLYQPLRKGSCCYTRPQLQMAWNETEFSPSFSAVSLVSAEKKRCSTAHFHSISSIKSVELYI